MTKFYKNGSTTGEIRSVVFVQWRVVWLGRAFVRRLLKDE